MPSVWAGSSRNTWGSPSHEYSIFTTRKRANHLYIQKLSDTYPLSVYYFTKTPTLSLLFLHTFKHIESLS